MSPYGMKQLTPENWLQPDPVTAPWMHIDPATGGLVHTKGEDRVRWFMEAQLVEDVPEDIRALFEAARGALVYGYLFHPIYALGLEQLTRVAEGAVWHRCRALGAPLQVHQGKRTRETTFAENLKWLVDHGALAPSQWDAWDNLRRWRNLASHADRQTLVSPSTAAGVLGRLAGHINALFDPTAPPAPPRQE